MIIPLRRLLLAMLLAIAAAAPAASAQAEEAEAERFLRLQCGFLTSPDARIRLGAREALRPFGRRGLVAVRTLATRVRSRDLAAFLDRTVASLSRAPDWSNADVDAFAARHDLDLAQVTKLTAVRAEIVRITHWHGRLVEAAESNEKPDSLEPLQQKWVLGEYLATFLDPKRATAAKKWVRANLFTFATSSGAYPRIRTWLDPLERDGLWHVLTEKQTVPPTPAELAAAPKLRLTYDLRTRDPDAMQRALSGFQDSLELAGWRSYETKLDTGKRSIVITLPVFNEKEHTKAKAALAGLTSTRFAIEATEAELRDPKIGIAPGFDVHRFLDAKRTTPTPLFENPEDPTKPAHPDQKRRYIYCPPHRYKRHDGTLAGREHGAIVHIGAHKSMSARHVATAEPHQGDFEIIIAYKLKKKAVPRFGRMTRENRGRRLCVIVNERVVYSPVIMSELLGHGLIEGVGDLDTVRQVVASLRAGLDVTPVLIREERLPARK